MKIKRINKNNYLVYCNYCNKPVAIAESKHQNLDCIYCNQKIKIPSKISCKVYLKENSEYQDEKTEDVKQSDILMI